MKFTEEEFDLFMNCIGLRVLIGDANECKNEVLITKFVKAKDELRALLVQPTTDNDSVKVPTSEEEAALMVGVGMHWLESNAPHRLKELSYNPATHFLVPLELSDDQANRVFCTFRDDDSSQSSVVAFHQAFKQVFKG